MAGEVKFKEHRHWSQRGGPKIVLPLVDRSSITIIGHYLPSIIFDILCCFCFSHKPWEVHALPILRCKNWSTEQFINFPKGNQHWSQEENQHSLTLEMWKLNCFSMISSFESNSRNWARNLWLLTNPLSFLSLTFFTCKLRKLELEDFLYSFQCEDLRIYYSFHYY